ncbi:hypothetical protein [Nonomuraea glycinis]|uniref:hypothetical protein n=1 Tax=Nonomuraea glycinis TaxID=2047744 RepID=UPI0033A89BC7
MMAVHRPGGRTQRCDGRCYTAGKDTDCDCVCEGMNHGVGLRQAIVNTREHAKRWETNARAQDPEIRRVEVGFEAQQDDLFAELV